MGAKTILISGLGIAGPTLAFWLRAGGFSAYTHMLAGGRSADAFVQFDNLL
jgi:hypothetical protein